MSIFQIESVKHLFPPIADYKASIVCDSNGFIHYNMNGNHIGAHWKNATLQWCKLCNISKIDTTLWILKYGEYLPMKVSDL